MKLLFIILLFAVTTSFAQKQSLVKDSVKTDSTKLDSVLFSQTDTLGLKLSYPQTHIPKNIITMPKPVRTPLDIDMRESSYYTPRNVQDKMDQIMNRPRRDTFMPVLAMAAFAVSVAAKQLEVEKLFELDAMDYLVSNAEFEILKQLWLKAPQTIDELYLQTGLQEEQTAKILQQKITALSDNNLIKTRGDGDKNILFFPAHKLDKVKELFKTALADASHTEQEIEQLKTFYDKLLLVKVDPEK